MNAKNADQNNSEYGHILHSVSGITIFDLQTRSWMNSNALDPNLSMITINYSYKISLLFSAVKFSRSGTTVLKMTSPPPK